MTSAKSSPDYVRSKLWDRVTAGDRHHGEVFSEIARDSVKFCVDWNRWLTWDGRRWSSESLTELEKWCKQTTARLFDAAMELGSDGDRKSALKGVERCASEQGKRGMLEFAKCQPEIARYSRHFDESNWLLNCFNGTLDLRNGTLREPSPEDYMTRITATEFLGLDYSLKTWDRFLDDVTAGDDELKEFLQRAAGYSLTGDTSEEKLFFVHGPAAAGKSTFLEAVKSAMGDYARTADFETFLKRHNAGGARNDIAILDGARMVISVEVDEGKSLAEGLVKQLTGGDTVTARFLYRESFEFRPTMKLWLAANDAPHISDADAGMWRRILRVPFENPVSAEKMDPELKGVLTSGGPAASAILSWAVRGCLKWQAGGLEVPESIVEATTDLRYEMDPLADFIEDVCYFEPSAHVSVARLREQYDNWAKNIGMKFTISPQKFNRRMERKGGKRVVATLSGKRCKVWMGIGLQEYSLVEGNRNTTGTRGLL